MANVNSSIEWTDATWSPTIGCTRVSAGCDHCYAFALHDMRHAAYQAGTFPDAPAQYHKPFSEVQLIPARLMLPLRWTKPRRIFVDSMSDLFHADVPDRFIAAVFNVMANAPQHTFQILTKRPQRMKRIVSDPEKFWGSLSDEDLGWILANVNPTAAPRLGLESWPLPNVWLGTSVENQEAAYRIDWLVRTPAAIRFLSCEPLLGPLDLSPYLCNHDSGMNLDNGRDEWQCTHCRATYRYVDDPDGPIHVSSSIPGEVARRVHQVLTSKGQSVDWVICGGESGAGFRSVDPAWVADLRDQCFFTDTPFFFKQWGGRTPKAGGRELDGSTWDQMPEVAS